MMECPLCQTDNDYTELKVDSSADEYGVEINFTCQGCGIYVYAVLYPKDFQPVD